MHTEALRAFGIRECKPMQLARSTISPRGRHGGSPLPRGLTPARRSVAAHFAAPFTLANARLQVSSRWCEGLADARQRLAPPETGHPNAPWDEVDYTAGVSHFMVDGPSPHGDTALGRLGKPMVAFGRDCSLATGWSKRLPRAPPTAFPHLSDHLTDLKPARVTSVTCRRSKRHLRS